MLDFKAKMHRIQFRLELHPRRRWGSLQRSRIPLAGFKGHSKGREGRREKREGKGREGKERGGVGSGGMGTTKIFTWIDAFGQRAVFVSLGTLFHSKLLLDNSASFTSSRMKDMCQKWKVKLILRCF